MAKPLVGVFILSWNRLEYTKRCVEALKDKTKYYNYIYLVLDQGSTDGSREWTENNAEQCILLTRNIGIPRAIERCHKYFRKNHPEVAYFCKLDNDVEILTSRWLLKIVNAMEDEDKHRDMILSPYPKGLVQAQGGVARGIPLPHPQRFHKHNISYTSNLGGMCIVYPRRIADDFEAQGGYPKGIKKHGGGEDYIFTGSWEKLNFYNGYIEDIYALHMDSTLGQQKKYPKYFDHPDHAGKLNPKDYLNYEKDF